MKNFKLFVGIPLILLVFAVLLSGCDPQVSENLLIGFWYATPKDAEKGDTSMAAFHFREDGNLLINNGNPHVKDWRFYSYTVKKGGKLTLRDQVTQAPARETTIEINSSGTELTVDDKCFLLKAKTYYKVGGGSYEVLPETKVETPVIVDHDGRSEVTCSLDETVIVTLDTDTVGAKIYYILDPPMDEDGSGGGDGDDGDDGDDTRYVVGSRDVDDPDYGVDPEDGGDITKKGKPYILGTKIIIRSETTKTFTLKAIAVKDGLTDSGTLETMYTFDSALAASVITPTATPNSGIFTTAQTANVTLTTSPEEEIYYTLDGKDPMLFGVYYTPGTSISIRSSKVGQVTLKAVAINDVVASSVYTSLPYIFSSTSTEITVTNPADTGANTLRDALTKIANGGKIIIDKTKVPEIKLATKLVIDRNVTIEGNSVIITTAEKFPSEGNSLIVNGTSLESGGKNVTIRRVHFKAGSDAGTPPDAGNGAAIYNYSGGSLVVESCIFTLNSTARGGAIFNEGTASAYVKGCTFYNNTATINGGAIYHNSGILVLQGNLFYSNTSASVVYIDGVGDKARSDGYNIYDNTFVTLSSGDTWTDVPTDRPFTDFGVSGSPFVDEDKGDFAIVADNDSMKIIITKPNGYPDIDFNGDTRDYPAVPGAVNIKKQQQP